MKNKHLGKSNNKILVAWWGALERGGETSGDLLSVMSVCDELERLGIPYDVCSKIKYDTLKHQVDWKALDPTHYDQLVFVCGPIIFENHSFRQLLQKFQKCRKVALGVSGISSNSRFPTFGFDEYLSRDGYDGYPNSLDLAINALPQKPLKHMQKKGRLTLGLCLRGAQRDYGKENCLSDKVDSMIGEVLDIYNFNPLSINTKLSQENRNPFKAFEELGNSDMVITTRLHGSLLSLASGVPFIAIDQIKNGAKVSKQLSLIDWPYVFHADSINSKTLINTISEILSSNNIAEILNASQNKAFMKAKDSLSRGMQLLREN